MQNNRPNRNIHTFLFILLCVALAVLASAATFRRGRTAKWSNSGSTPATTNIWTSDALDGSSEKSFCAGRSL